MAAHPRASRLRCPFGGPFAWVATVLLLASCTSVRAGNGQPPEAEAQAQDQGVGTQDPAPTERPPSSTTPDEPPTARVGPSQGTLMLVGGIERGTPLVEYFLELAGGNDVPIVVIPTAMGADHYDESSFGPNQVIGAGGTQVTVLHADDRTVADSEAFVAPIRAARGVWISGGRQWRLADRYLGTATQDALEDLLARGGIIGGSSAGATIMGSYLARGDTKSNEIMMGDHEEGFGFLRDVTIDQHLLTRNRHFDLLEIVRARPELLGLGIDADTAIVVQRDRFQVVGRGYVAIYDHESSIDSGGSFYFLAGGDEYDLVARKPVIVPANALSLGRVVERSWSAPEP